MTVEPTPSPAEQASPVAVAPPRRRWFHRLTTILLVIFCFELGCFLMAAPWWGAFWENNFFASLVGDAVWANAYFRGAVSGIGVLNLYVSLAELFGMNK
jgi:hypothetical protein